MNDSTQQQSHRPARRFNAVAVGMWLIGFGLLANAAVMLLKPHSRFPDEITFDTKAYAQSGGGGAGAPVGPAINTRGIYMMPAQLGVNTWGVYLLDLDSSTIVVYRALPEANRFKLMAARSWKSDRFLEDFNNDAPTPKDVARLVEIQRQRMELKAQDTQPANPPVPNEEKKGTE
jgi:hypothetical protein